MKVEHDAKRNGTYEEVLESDLVREANIITSHAVIKGKSNDDGTLKLKGRLAVHANSLLLLVTGIMK